jgi:hypothetical protein
VTQHRFVRFGFILALVVAFAGRARAQEISFLAGGMSTATVDRFNALLGAGHETSYAWQLDFRHDVDAHFAWSASWLNEGHTRYHHRDGFATELWADVLSSDRFDLSLGAGAYRFFDTRLLANGETQNLHGWTPIYSASLTYATATPWFFRLTANRVSQARGLATNTLLLGAGYRLGKDGASDHRGLPRGMWETKRTPMELTAFWGKSVVNTGASEDAVATGLEFRQGLSRNLDWTLSWINEGDPKIIRRNGLAAQIWVVDEYFVRHLSLGFGAGAYWYFDKKNPPADGLYSDQTLAALLSPTIAYRFSPHWQARLTWNRVLSDYNRDADVILIGLGYRWGRAE